MLWLLPFRKLLLSVLLIPLVDTHGRVCCDNPHILRICRAQVALRLVGTDPKNGFGEKGNTETNVE